MTNRKAVVIVCIIMTVFIAVPLFVIKRTFDMKSGWKGLQWGSTQEQVRFWIRQNNTNYTYNLCSLSHFGVVCYRLSWKSNSESMAEYIEFQFKDGLLCAVIETSRPTESDPSEKKSLGSRVSGKDMHSFYVREKGSLYSYVERVFYYIPENSWKYTKKRYAVSCLVRNKPADSSFADETVLFRLTSGWYSGSYFAEASGNYENFPSSVLKLKK